jgi:hypothetical protein
LTHLQNNLGIVKVKNPVYFLLYEHFAKSPVTGSENRS